MKKLFIILFIASILINSANVLAQANTTEKRGTEWLGKGYRGYNNYADSKSVTPYSIYDMTGLSALVSEVPGKEVQIYTGTSNNQYYTNRFAKINASPFSVS